MGAPYGLTPGEWRTLQLAPFWMLGAVVGAYRGFDRLEYDAFSRALQLAALAPGGLNQELMSSVASDVRELGEDFAGDPRTIASGLSEVAAILAKVPRDEADMVTHALIHGIGEGVATARGRFGRVMSEDDSKDLDLIAEILQPSAVGS